MVIVPYVFPCATQTSHYPSKVGDVFPFSLEMFFLWYFRPGELQSARCPAAPHFLHARSFAMSSAMFGCDEDQRIWTISSSTVLHRCSVGDLYFFKKGSKISMIITGIIQSVHGFVSTCYVLIWLVVWTPLKNISQLGWLFPIYGKIKNVPNHQPVITGKGPQVVVANWTVKKDLSIKNFTGNQWW